VTTLYRRGFVQSPVDPSATAMVVDEGTGTLAWVGGEAAADRYGDVVDSVVDLDGALVTPAFVDAHVHLSQTGARLHGVDLGDTPTLAAAFDRIRDAVRTHRGRPVYAPNWDEGTWAERRSATAAELDRASFGGIVYSPRVDGHSAVISSALAVASGAPQLPGWDGAGLVTREAHHAAREAFHATITSAQRRADIEAALQAAAAAGIGLVHENGGRILSSADDFADVLAAGTSGDGPQTIGYWAQLVTDEAEARAVAGLHGARGLAGDLNVDGSIGSRTAFLREPYTDRPGHRGSSYLSVEQMRDHVAACSLAGLQAGFHVIGDAGVDTVVAGFEAAAQLVGAEVVRRARHRLEHLEMVDRAGIERLAALGVTASVQPAFDAVWGGGEGRYAERLGPRRAAGMNPFRAMLAVGMTIALGSDSPVTPFAPWEAIRACVHHHDADQRISPQAAFLAHTRGGWLAAGIEDQGYLAQAMPATFAVWSVEALVAPPLDERAEAWGPGSGSGTTRLPDLSPGAPVPVCLRTVVRGRTVFDAGALGS
jgi:predicted amidohydrolase YtcJ